VLAQEFVKSRTSAGLVGQKISQLELRREGREGYAYYCGLCEEILVLSGRLIEPRKVILVFDETCPGCGFELDKVLRCEISKIPFGANIFANPRCAKANYLAEPSDEFIHESSFRRGDELPSYSKPNLTVGVEALDRTIVLSFGELAVLQGRISHSLSLRLCVRAVLSHPLGPDSDVIFIDGGNSFDAYTISERSIEYELDSESVLQRIHLSRAFTYHQLTTLIKEKLPLAIDRFNARVAIVSDITELYCDPDIQANSRQEALDTFANTVRFLAATAKRKDALIVATNLKSRNPRMDRILLHTAHLSAVLEERGSSTELTVPKHPWNAEHRALVQIAPDNKTLENYF
jgi:hypothetical protein